ncbi:protein of unknown function [Kyrpidia spormannii]|uniref:Uncharacterized protein n=2 Tax=Kyrpidia spormannii TaxID=2055160 RepID=A0ACA8ZC04_9BACL|nr:protein of unknown function [Kyrpidia spormannii]CAB3395485.1 protein of unknown function [Kyrpidia spormannii]
MLCYDSTQTFSRILGKLGGVKIIFRQLLNRDYTKSKFRELIAKSSLQKFRIEESAEPGLDVWLER